MTNKEALLQEIKELKGQILSDEAVEELVAKPDAEYVLLTKDIDDKYNSAKEQLLVSRNEAYKRIEEQYDEELAALDARKAEFMSSAEDYRNALSRATEETLADRKKSIELLAAKEAELKELEAQEAKKQSEKRARKPVIKF